MDEIQRQSGVEAIIKKRVEVHNSLRRVDEYITAHKGNPTSQHPLDTQNLLSNPLQQLEEPSSSFTSPTILVIIDPR